MSSGETPEAEVLNTVETANYVWATTVSKTPDDYSKLECVYAGQWLAQVRASVDAMRAAGQYRLARPTVRAEVRSIRQLGGGRSEALVVEQWDDRLYNADGSLARNYPPRVEQRYVIQSGPPPADCRYSGDHPFIVESELVRSE